MAVLINNPKQRGILIVDNEAAVRDTLKDALERSGYAKVYTAEDAARGISLLAAHGERIYLLILDIRMPGMSGINMIEHVANTHQYPVGVVVLTGYPELDSCERFFTSRTKNVIPLAYKRKPLDITDIIQTVTDTLGDMHRKRRGLVELSSTEVLSRLDDLDRDLREGIEPQLHTLRDDIQRLRARQPTALQQIGMGVITIILVGLVVLAVLYLGIDDIIRSVINSTP